MITERSFADQRLIFNEPTDCAWMMKTRS